MAIVFNKGQRGFVLTSGILEAGKHIELEDSQAEKLAGMYPAEIEIISPRPAQVKPEAEAPAEPQPKAEQAQVKPENKAADKGGDKANKKSSKK